MGFFAHATTCNVLDLRGSHIVEGTCLCSYWSGEYTVYTLIVSITKFSIVIGSPRKSYLSRNRRAITMGVQLQLSDLSNRPFATNDHMVQNPPYWRASSLLFPHWDVKTKRPQSVKRDWPLFLCPSAAIIISLPSSMADFVPCDRLLQIRALLDTCNWIPT